MGAPRSTPALQLAAFDSTLSEALGKDRTRRAVGLRLATLYGAPIVPLDSLGQGDLAAQRRNAQASESIETLTKRLADQSIADYELREGEIYQLVIDQIEKALIEKALAKCGNVKTKAADYLGINRNTLNKKVKDLAIEAVDNGD